jgi:membrane fusion protein, copper/silver efflux system
MSGTRWILLVVATALLSAAGSYWFAYQRADHSMAKAASAARKPLYWYDPMVPDQRFDQAGKSPFMDMQLVAKYADETIGNSAASAIKIDAGVMQNLGIRMATVQRSVLAQSTTTTGNIVFNQRDVAVVQSRTNGFVERVYQRAPGDVIAKGAALVDLLVPEWAGAQAEYLALLKTDDKDLISAARQRLLLLGMSTELIADIEAKQQPQISMTIRTPIAGVIDTLEVRAGMSVSAGVTLAKIIGLGTVWLEAQLPEAQSGLVSIGRSVTATLAAYPAETFTGKVIAMLPEASVENRTVRVRAELQNPQQRLRPGSFAQVRLDSGEQQPVLFVPSEAIIRSGTRNVVIVANSDHHFKPVEVQLGAESNDKTVIVSGLEEGQQVVASGQFLIDSEASLQGVLARMNGPHEWKLP